jgi:hypothetical protein
VARERKVDREVGKEGERERGRGRKRRESILSLIMSYHIMSDNFGSRNVMLCRVAQ